LFRIKNSPQKIRAIRAFRGKTSPCEPENPATFPEDQQLMPENEPEKNLKMNLKTQLYSAFRSLPDPSRSSQSLRFKPSKTSGHFNLFNQNPTPFQTFQPQTPKNPAIHTVPFCSALFRQKISLRSYPHPSTQPLLCALRVLCALCVTSPCRPKTQRSHPPRN
jgi:hypothetical protein